MTLISSVIIQQYVSSIWCFLPISFYGSRANKVRTKWDTDSILVGQRPGVSSGLGFRACDVGPGDHHRVGGADFIILGESPVDVLGR